MVAHSLHPSSGEYHPLYNYSKLPDRLFVEAWRKHGAMWVSGTSMGKYAPLPMER